MKRWNSRKDRLFLHDRPLELNFVMRPSGHLAGRLVDEQGKPLAGYSVSLRRRASAVFERRVLDLCGRAGTIHAG
jgi:hypothetical protein